MPKIIKCKMNGHLTELPCSASECNSFGDCLAEYEKEQMTNADRVRVMSDEELANQLIEYRDDWGDYIAPNCEFYDTYEEAKVATIKRLKQPAEEN